MKNREKIIIGIVGNIGAGKGTVTAYLTRRYGAVNFRYSAILQDILRRLHLEVNRRNLAELAEALRAAYGADILSRVLLDDINSADNSLIVVEGIRKRAELESLRTLPNFKLFFVTADMETRYRRIVKRGEKADDRFKSFEEFQADHRRPADADIETLRDEADFLIDNNGCWEDTKKQIDDIMKKEFGK